MSKHTPKAPENGDLRVWWIPMMPFCVPVDIPMMPVYVLVDTVAQGVWLMDVLANYDTFRFRVPPEYSNEGGIQVFHEDDDTDGPEGSWVDWYDEETGEDDPRAWLENQQAAICEGEL